MTHGERGEPTRVLVSSPAPPGVGGLGGATLALSDGFTRQGATVVEMARGGHDRFDDLLRTRPLRRYAGLIRRRTAWTVRRAAHESAMTDIVVAMPGCLPETAARTALHQATMHPQRALELMVTERRRVGGGTPFLSPPEVRRNLDELGRVSLVRTETAALQDDLLGRGTPPSCILHAYPGVDLDRFAPGIKASHPIVAFVGTLSLWKGLDRLAQTARSLPPGAELRVVGGPVCRWSRRTAESFDWTPQASVPQLLASAHFLLLPSVSDGFGYVVLEALASGCVPIVTPEVGASEIVRRLDPSLVVEASDFAESAAARVAAGRDHRLELRARCLAMEFPYTQMADAAAVSILQRLAGLAIDARSI